MNQTEVFAVLVSVALTCDCGQAQPAIPGNPPIPDRELLIATKEAPPFAMKQQDGTWRGISIDLWRRMAERLHLRYRFSEQATVQNLGDAARTRRGHRLDDRLGHCDRGVHRRHHLDADPAGAAGGRA